MEDQRILHYFISTIANFQQTNTTPVVAATVPVVEDNTNEDTEEFVDPNQTNILDQIAETESNEANLDSLESESSDTVPERLTEDELVDQLYGVDNSPEVVVDIVDDESPVYDEDQIKERIAEDEAAVAEVCDPKTDGDEDHVDGVDELPTEETTEPTTVEDEFAEEDNFSLDFNEDTKEDQDNIPDFF
jgi:hypothetical protein